MKRRPLSILLLLGISIQAYCIEYQFGASYLPVDLVSEDGSTSFNVHPFPGTEFALNLPLGTSVLTQISLEMDELIFLSNASDRESIISNTALVGVGCRFPLGERTSIYALGEAGWAPISLLSEGLHHAYFYELGASAGLEWLVNTIERESQVLKKKSTQDFALYVECAYRHAFAGYTILFYNEVHPYSLNRIKISAGLSIRTKVESL